MAKQTLPVNYVDDIMNESVGGKRKYRMIYNDDGTVSFEDVTPYDQVGSDFGAGDINSTNKAVNDSADASKIIDDMDAINALTQPGYIAGGLALKEVNSSLQKFMQAMDYDPNNPLNLISYTGIDKVGKTLTKTWATKISSNNEEIFRINPKGNSIKFDVTGDMVYPYYYKVNGGSLIQFSNEGNIILPTITLPNTSNDVIFYVNSGGNQYQQSITLSNFRYA